jgi:hypothetical protein
MEKMCCGPPLIEKYHYREGILEIFCKENYFSEEKSHELSQVGRPSTAHLSHKGGGIRTVSHKRIISNNENYFFYLDILPIYIIYC